MLPSTGILLDPVESDCTVMPPSSRLWPSTIRAWVLSAERRTTGMLSTLALVSDPSSMLTSMRIRVWLLSRVTCGVTRRVVPLLTLNRSTSRSPARRT